MREETYKRNNLLNNLEQAIELLNQKKTQLSDSPTLYTILERYCTARNELKENGELKTSLIGGVRAYLNAFSDYENNSLLEIMGYIETLLLNNMKEGKLSE
ncbi:MAG: hypothetical protein LUC97_05495 [Clostridiales bacterium]|nr:hypothetical protein [Clostridiales bacterium]